MNHLSYGLYPHRSRNGLVRIGVIAEGSDRELS
jgi:hypothetical protein